MGIHDLLADGAGIMRALTPLTGTGFRVVAPDLRGHGASPCPDGPWSIDDFASDVARIVASRGGPAIVVGQGLGAAAALALALGHPGLVSGLVLSGVGPRGEDQPGQERWMKVSRAFEERGQHGASRAAEAMANRPDWRGALAQLDVRSVVIAGERDRATPPEVQRELAVWLRNAGFQAVPTGHDVAAERPGILLAAVKHLVSAAHRSEAVAA
ncbi:MAG: alpha/beta fold hydrolase [Thermoleophilia bacterium]|nr:alpha/beta fold hydrolase [Thermoleophilia bacterium]